MRIVLLMVIKLLHYSKKGYKQTIHVVIVKLKITFKGTKVNPLYIDAP